MKIIISTINFIILSLMATKAILIKETEIAETNIWTITKT
jgi:hypothetical protein